MISFLSGKLHKEIAFLLVSTFCLNTYASLKLSSTGNFNEWRFAPTYTTDNRVPTEKFHSDQPERTKSAKQVSKPVRTLKHQAKKDIGGPGQPEMQSFQSANANNMVDLFSGDFSYNIPLLDVGGYPVNIHYNSNVSMDQEASWVGLGWNINPGTIGRNMRGVPDDFNGKDSIRKTLHLKDNISVGVTGDFVPEILGKELNKLGKPSLGISYNNYTGPSLEVGLNPTLSSGKFALGEKTFGIDSMNSRLDIKLSSSNGLSVQPTLSSNVLSKESQIAGTGTIGLNFNSRSGLQDLTIAARGPQKAQLDNRNQLFAPFSSSITFARTATVPKVNIPFTSFQFSFKVKGGGEFFGLHPLTAIGGYYSQQYISSKDTTSVLPAYGYMHYQSANKNPGALLDFNREFDLPYNKNLPCVGLPVYTYDTYSITGEGTGGMFRPYRSEVGYVFDHNLKSKNNSGNFSLDLGVGNLAHWGADLSYNYSFTENRKWTEENSLKNNIGFRESDTTFEAVYFRNPSEKTSNTQAFYDAIGNNDLVRAKLGSGLALPQVTNQLVTYNNQKQAKGLLSVTQSLAKTTRDKRAQIITYLTASEASKVALDTVITVYRPWDGVMVCSSCQSVAPNDNSNLSQANNSNGDSTSSPPVSVPVLPSVSCYYPVKESRISAYRKAHHISQITVLNPDGRTYVYGLPIYNKVQKEVTFSVDQHNSVDTNKLVSYQPGIDNSAQNNRGKDHFYSSEETPAYAHSFLLTALLSPDYVDVKGDGITEDDKGDAIKFNYSRIYSLDAPYRWRTPYSANSATYNQGLRTDNSDDKGSYVYGEKEIWYLHSIESKTMVAVFTLADRNDSKGVLGENGGRDELAKLKRLKEINLYAKRDLAKYGPDAKPIKTVHFSYSYTLCQGVETAGSGGKLTLDSIWFSYNNNYKGRANPYFFKYHSNPAYNKKSYDRWGNYKAETDNPSGFKNDEFPYVRQDSVKAAANAHAWLLDTLYTPSGGKMVVDYESDDYAFVQNRRAMQMFTIAGFNNSPSFSSIKSQLYNGLNDNNYLLVTLPFPVASSKEFYQQYLEGINKLYVRISVHVPKDQYGSGYEYIPCYLAIEGYGIDNNDHTKAWIQLKQEKGMNPLLLASTQFLRLNLSSKAYPGSNLANQNAAAAAIKTLFSLVANVSSALTSLETKVRINGWMRDVDVAKSLVRLNSPSFKKYGGGLRVKRIRLFDNWKKMSGQKESVYGQEYRYTTQKEIAGKKITISSGVATYEPNIGNEENPFHVPIEYSESSSLIGPSTNLYIDNPVGETYFPSPSVGYSKVRVTSINRKNIRSANGFEETEFYTAAEFPVINDYTPLDKSSRVSFNSPLSLFISDTRHYTTISQGFKIELNDMHGKIKSQATYAENDSLNPISYTKNYYLVQNASSQQFRLRNAVPVLDSANGHVTQDCTVGKDIELMVDLREQKSQTIGANVQLNADNFILPIGIFPLILHIPSFIPKPVHAVNLYRSAVVMKVINSYGILDSVVHFDKGSTVSVKNAVYDQETGDPVLVRSQNAFNDPVYSYSYPSHYAYLGGDLAYKNIGTVVNIASISNGYLGEYERFFVHGDEVFVTGRENLFNCAPPIGINPIDIVVLASTRIAVSKRLWVISGDKIGLPGHLYLIDEKGKLFSGSNLSVKIIRSGRRNATSTVGTLTMLQSPLQYVNNHWQIVLNDSPKILSANALLMKEDWREDSTVTCTAADSTSALNPFLHGLVGNWRTFRSYTYYGPRAERNALDPTNIRKNGTFADFKPFWNVVSNNLVPAIDSSRWVWNSEITLVNRKGFEVENRDPLGRYNSGVYGYAHALPVAVAQNAKYREISYEGFEEYADYQPCDTTCHETSRNHFSVPPVDSTQHHTGKFSLRVDAGTNVSIEIPVVPSDSAGTLFYQEKTILFSSNNAVPTAVPDTATNLSIIGPPNFQLCHYNVVRARGSNAIPSFSPLRGTKMVLSVWVKESRQCNCDSYTENEIEAVLTPTNPQIDIVGYTFKPSNNIIEGWQRYEAIIDVSATTKLLTIKFKAPSSTTAYFDDFRMHPFNANLKSFVYHPTSLRLMAELDENNYATFYEYDDEGTLVRVKKETEKGIKTIKETRSALLK